MTIVVQLSPTASVVGDVASAEDIRNCFRRKAEDWPVITQLALGGLADSGNSLSLTDDADIAIGTMLNVDDEWILVTDGTATPWTCLRAQRASEATSHAGFSVVYIEPRWGNDQITDSTTNVLATLWPEVYAVQTFDITPNTDGSLLYPAPADVEDVLRISQDTGSSVADVWELDGKFVKVRRVDTGISSSGVMVEVPMLSTTSEDATVFYRTRVTESNLEAGLGLATVCWGVAADLLTGKLLPRTADDSKANSQLATSSDLLRGTAGGDQQFQRHKARWKAALDRKWQPSKRYRRA